MAQSAKIFKETDLNSLESCLQELKSKIGENGQLHTSFTTKNMIIITSGEHSQESDQDLLNHLVKVNPGRFFLIVFSKTMPSASYKLSARCEIVSIEDKICSEIIKIECASDAVLAVAALLRGHLLSGVATDTFIADAEPVNELVARNIIALSEQVIYDGLELGGLNKADWLGKYCSTRIDLQWLQLSPWREAVRMIFEIPSFGSRLKMIDRITIGSVNSDSGEVPLAALYLAGWTLGCLGLEVVALGVDSYECRTREGRTLNLEFSDAGFALGFNKLNFYFTLPDNSANNTSSSLLLELCRAKDAIECSATGIAQFRATYQLKEASKLELIQRFFLVGTSVNQYDSALRLAIDLENLKQGYRFS